MAVVEGQAAPHFELQAVNAEKSTVTLDELKGQWVVIYFYPKDMTSGCTTEANDFQAHLDEFTMQGAVVLGISKDSLLSHEKFATKFHLKFPLLSDGDGQVCEAYGVFKEKKMYGRTYMGIERSTFLVDPVGKVAKVFPKVKVTGHVDQVLKELAIRQ